MDRVSAQKRGVLGGCNIIEFAIDVELVFGLHSFLWLFLLLRVC
jgi:hypothetical protein